MKNKNLFWSLLAIVIATTMSVGLSSCVDDDENPYLEVEDSSASFEIKIDGESGNHFDIKSNVNWKVSSDKEWIKIQGQEEGEDNATIYFDVEKNEEYGDDRKGVITITSTTKGVSSKYVNITQKSKKAQLEVSPTSVSPIKGEGGTVNFSITANLKWQVSSNQSWLTIDNKDGDGNGFITATAEPNGTSSLRTATLTFSGKEGNPNSITVSISQEPGGISVSPTSASLLSDKGSTTNLTVTATGSWSLTGCPEWLHASATSGVGVTNVTLTTLSENWSDESRSAVLTFTANTLSATCSVNQLPSLPTGLRVEVLNETLMSDGFAYDLKFGPDAKGYKEAFYYESKYLTMTDRDIYNELMKETEYNALDDYTFLPGFVDPGTNLIYCVAAYGNDNNSDGTHKYGPITIVRVTTKQQTLQDDMYMSSSYTSSQWKVTTSRTGKYGQKCDEYYYYAAENDFAEELSLYYRYWTYAVLAHMFFKPMIADNPSQNYKYGPQTMTWSRNYDKFFCITWGIDRDTKEYSADLSDPVYWDLSSSSRELKRQMTSQEDLNRPHERPSRAEINRLRKAICIYKAK